MDGFPAPRHGNASTGTSESGDPGEILIALTRLVSRWNSQDFQRSVALTSGIELDPTAVRALYAMGGQGGTATPSAVAEAVHLSRPSTSKLLARLTTAGLIQRSVQANDRRSVAVSLTERGQATFDELFGAGIAMVEAATADWEPADREALQRLLPRFLTHLSTPPPR